MSAMTARKMAGPATTPMKYGRKQPLLGLTITDFIAEIELQHPPLNLVTKSLLEQLHQALIAIDEAKKVRCVVLHQGSARAFCAGSDMQAFKSVRKRAVDAKILYEEYVIRQLAQLSCPVIAAIDGPALGGGFELALACDLRVAGQQARVGLTECLIGGLGGSGAVRLTRLVGPARAGEMLFTGKVLDAAQAHAWGLVNEVAPQGQALERAREIAGQIASRGPLSNAYAKRLIAASLDEPATAALSLANQLQDRIFRSEDLMRGAQAFFTKTCAEFEGR
jgi:enoyl-CoA hydratase/carnithine racemase